MPTLAVLMHVLTLLTVWVVLCPDVEILIPDVTDSATESARQVRIFLRWLALPENIR